VVIGDGNGDLPGNYHGTTILTQVMRGMWPELRESISPGYRVVAVRPNDIEGFRRTIEENEVGSLKVAGFLHELILMNYGAVRLRPEFVGEAHAICHSRDIPVCVDEIQSCMWSPELFLFREYGLRPDFVAVGKGFPGGEFPASRVMTTAPMDNLNQFGALVTNGQEELASLAYLITMRFAEANGEYVQELGDYYAAKLRGLADQHERLISKIEGTRHLSSLFFRDSGKAVAFAEALNRAGIDISVHAYKEDGAPSALTKLPLTATPAMVDFLVGRMDEVLASL
jgi:acetylornithine/succinyldiaminopimelate/putrescine aminotransferase